MVNFKASKLLIEEFLNGEEMGFTIHDGKNFKKWDAQDHKRVLENKGSNTGGGSPFTLKINK